MSFQISFGDSDMALLIAIIGFAVLVMGRQIFWIFIAGLGFTLGLLFASQYYTAQFEWRVLLISTVIAVVGAVLAYTLQRLAAGIAGFATGWYFTIVLLGYFNPNLGQIEVVIPYIVGIICGTLLMMYFDWGVIIASSLAGSAILVSTMKLARNVELVFLVMLALVGMAIQGIWFMQEK